MLMDLIEELALLRGVSGDEDEVARRIGQRLAGKCELRRDAAGNLIAFCKGRRGAGKNKVLLAAHMDEVGFIITHVEESGLLRFSTVGGIDSRVVFGKRVLVGPKAICGVIGAKPIHLQEKEESEKPMEVEKLYIDIGAADKAQAEQLVSPGDRAVFDSGFVRFGDGFFKCRALDDRAGCAVLVDLIEQGVEYDTWFAFTVQEEVGTRGAKTVAFSLRPDCALVVETTTAGDVPGAPPEKQMCRLGKGPVVSFMDRGAIYDQELYRLAFALAGEKGLPLQAKLGVAGGNDARSLQSAASGARCLAVSMPCRYLHSPSCVLQEEDVKNTAKLVSALAERMAQL